MVSYTFAEKSTFQIPQNSDVGLFPSVMTQRLPDIAEDGKHWSSYPGITGGRKCPATSENMFPLVTCVSARKHPADHLWVNSTLFRFQTVLGMRSVWTLYRNYRRQMEKTALWLWLIPLLNVCISSIPSPPFPQSDPPGYTSNMCGNTMAYLRKSFLIVAHSS